MASRYSIETIFKLIDGVTAPLKSIDFSSKAFSKNFQQDVTKAQLKWKAFGQSMKTYGKLALTAGIAAVGAGLVDSTKKYIEFEDSITKAGSKFVDLDVTSSTFAEDLEQLQTAARKVGAQTKYSATDAAGALDKMAMAGMTSKQSMALLMGTTNLATAAGSDLTTAVDMATDALGAFGFTRLAGDDENALAGYLDRVSDVVAKTTNMANTDMTMWFDAVKNGASTFTSMGGTLEQFSGMVGILANAGIKGGEAGTALRNIMLNLGAPTSAASKALSKLGIEVYDTEGKMLPIIDIMGQFEKSLGGLDEEAKNNALENIFGKRNVGSFLTLMNAGTEQIQKYVTTLEQSQGTAEAIARAQEKSLKGQFAVLRSAIEDKQLSFGKALMENGGSKGLAALIDKIQKWDPKPVIDFMIGVLDKLPQVIQFVGNLVSKIWQFKEVILTVLGVIAAYKVIVGAVAAAQMVWNAVMLANPIGLIIAGVSALIVLIVQMIRHWDEWGSKLLTIIGGPLSTFVEVIMSIVRNFDRIKAAFTDGGFLAGVKMLGGAILSGVLQPIRNVLEMLSNLPGVGKFFGAGAEKIAGLQGSLTGGTTAPITSGERNSYSREESNSTVDLNVNMAKGLQGSVTGTAPGVNIRTTASAAVWSN